MAATLVAELPGLAVKVRELTVAEVRDWFAERESGAPVDPLRAMMFDDCSIDDLAMMSDATAEQLEAFGETDLAVVRDKAKAINPYFFRVREALMGVSRILQQEAAWIASTTTSASLPSEAMPASSAIPGEPT